MELLDGNGCNTDIFGTGSTGAKADVDAAVVIAAAMLTCLLETKTSFSFKA